MVAAATKHGWSVDNGCAQAVYRLTGGHPLRRQYCLSNALAKHGKLTPQSVLAVHAQSTVAHLNGLRLDSRLASTGAPASIFASYSHENESDKEQLMTHLGVLGNTHQAQAWCDDRIGVGADWHQEIRRAIDSAQVAVLLITPHFLDSRLILDEEVPRIRARLARKELCVVPIVGRPCAWQQLSWQSNMNVRPKNASPIWREGGVHADQELTDIVQEIAPIL